MAFLSLCFLLLLLFWFCGFARNATQMYEFATYWDCHFWWFVCVILVQPPFFILLSTNSLLWFVHLILFFSFLLCVHHFKSNTQKPHTNLSHNHCNVNECVRITFSLLFRWLLCIIVHCSIPIRKFNAFYRRLHNN